MGKENEVLKEKWLDAIASETMDADLNGNMVYGNYVTIDDPNFAKIELASQLLREQAKMTEEKIDDKFSSISPYIFTEGNQMLYGYIAVKPRRTPLKSDKEGNING